MGLKVNKFVFSFFFPDRVVVMIYHIMIYLILAKLKDWSLKRLPTFKRFQFVVRPVSPDRTNRRSGTQGMPEMLRRHE